MSSRFYFRIDEPGRGVRDKEDERSNANETLEPREKRDYGIDNETIEILEDDQVQTGG